MTRFTFLAALVTMLASQVVHAYGDDHTDGFHYAYYSAYELWVTGFESGTYACDSPEDVTGPFASDVQVEVVAECNRYNPFVSEEWREGCRAGAQEYIEAQTWVCTSESRCVDYGKTAMNGIVASLCKPPRSGYALTYAPTPDSDDVMTPEYCQEAALDYCRANVVTQANTKINAGTCPGHPDLLTYEEKRELKSECNEKLPPPE